MFNFKKELSPPKQRFSKATVDQAVRIDDQEHALFRKTVQSLRDKRGSYQYIGVIVGEKKGEVDTIWEDTRSLLCVGVLKSFAPILLIACSGFFVASPSPRAVQHRLEQVAGGLLVWTWGAKCMAPAGDKLKKLMDDSTNLLCPLIFSIITILLLVFCGTPAYKV